MDESATSATITEIDRGRRWPQEVRELAFDLWVNDAAGSCAEVATRLADDGYEVPARTVRYWRDSERWEERMADAARIAFPALSRQMAIRLMQAADAGSGYVVRVAQGIEAPDKTRLAAAFGALDRVGFSPLGRSQAPSIDNAEQSLLTALPANLSELDADALERVEREYREKTR